MCQVAWILALIARIHDSLRRSGVTHLFTLGITVETIKMLGDWKSDCVFTYLKPKPHDKRNILKTTT